ncbi:hypothetical protein [Paenibacillus roseipurpureus]|uniref:Uncharacterized protein n=1 Tax=Paenibacillus roseopurpureus TaxID=2918901 RepID=A0AA96LKQ8_9BACL|nr:hypothetical protein [Paenibacillus sp. MBLB1832]WNR43667.1 hypothetical protein MJB10_21580 [Paenibacillus sp. MBLB1832]
MQTAIITSSLTVVSGVIVFFFSQILLKYIIEPISDFRKIRSQISVQLIYYANIYSNLFKYNEENKNNEKLVVRLDEVSNTFRKLASELIGISNIIPFYSLFSIMRLIPSRKNIQSASSNLIGLSNSIWTNGINNEDNNMKYNRERKNEIVKLLRIKSM